jgi:hypothetical protein
MKRQRHWLGIVYPAKDRYSRPGESCVTTCRARDRNEAYCKVRRAAGAYAPFKGKGRDPGEYTVEIHGPI